MAIRSIEKPDWSMGANQLVREFTIPEKSALVRGFLLAVEAGLVDTDQLVTVDQKEAMRALFPVIEKYWNGA